MGCGGPEQKSCFGLAEIASSVFLGLLNDGNAGWIQDFMFLFLMLIKITRKQGKFKIFLRDPRDGIILLRSCASWEVGRLKCKKKKKKMSQKKFFINNSAEALSLRRNIRVYWNCLYLFECFQCVEEAFQNLWKSCLSFRGCLEGSENSSKAWLHNLVKRGKLLMDASQTVNEWKCCILFHGLKMP